MENSPVDTQLGTNAFASPPIANRDPDPVHSGLMRNSTEADPDNVYPPEVENTFPVY